MKLNRIVTGATFTALSLGNIAVYGSLVGDSMSIDYRYPDANSVIDTGPSFSVTTGGTSLSDNLGGINFDISVTADTITISRFQPGSAPFGLVRGFSGPPGSPDGAMDVGVSFNGIVFTDLSQNFPAATIASVTSLPGFDSSRLSVVGDHLKVNFMGLYYTSGDSELVLNIGGASSVPEGGSTVVLLGIAFSVFACAR